MASEMSLTERLMRQKNSILQRQLEVKLKIMEIEHKTTQHEIIESQRDCTMFLATISNTWAGLDHYKPPDTFAMAKEAVTRNNRLSMVSISSTDLFAPAKTLTFINQVKKAKSATVFRTYPEKRLNSNLTIMDVLDDILKAQSKWVGEHKPPQRRSKVGVVVVPPKNDRTRRIASAPSSNYNVKLISDKHFLQPKKQIPSLDGDCKRVHTTTTSTGSAQVPRAGVYGKQPRQTEFEEKLVLRRTSIDKSTNTLIRPHTVVTSPVVTRKQRISAIINAIAASDEDNNRKRPKTAPTKYELYARSPAVSRRTRAGMMAEINSRCAETREHVKDSHIIKVIVEKLRPPQTYDQQDIIDDA